MKCRDKAIVLASTMSLSSTSDLVFSSKSVSMVSKYLEEAIKTFLWQWNRVPVEIEFFLWISDTFWLDFQLIFLIYLSKYASIIAWKMKSIILSSKWNFWHISIDNHEPYFVWFSQKTTYFSTFYWKALLMKIWLVYLWLSKQNRSVHEQPHDAPWWPQSIPQGAWPWS